MRVSSRLALAAGSILLASTAATLAAPAVATPSGGGCELSGTANFIQGPNATSAGRLLYTFSGTLTDCQSSPGGPATGRIATMRPATGGGTCVSNATSGIALVTWADRSTTIVSYSTSGLGAEVSMAGHVIPSYKIGKKVYRTTRDKGDALTGNVIFGANPVECYGGAVTSASITGVAALTNDN
jgi:hypothetical protein